MRVRSLLHFEHITPGGDCLEPASGRQLRSMTTAKRSTNVPGLPPLPRPGDALRAMQRLTAAVSPPPVPRMTVDELTSALSFLCVLAAVKHGATLTVTGPRSVVNPEHEQIGATLESQTGARCVHAEGDDLTTVLVELAQKYGAGGN
jgi:hypothetical protein